MGPHMGTGGSIGGRRESGPASDPSKSFWDKICSVPQNTEKQRTTIAERVGRYKIMAKLQFQNSPSNLH